MAMAALPLFALPLARARDAIGGEESEKEEEEEEGREEIDRWGPLVKRV